MLSIYNNNPKAHTKSSDSIFNIKLHNTFTCSSRDNPSSI